MSEIQSHMWYHCIQYTKRHHMSLINSMLKKANSVDNGASKEVLGSYDGAWYTEHNGTTFVTVSQILMESDFSSARITFDRFRHHRQSHQEVYISGTHECAWPPCLLYIRPNVETLVHCIHPPTHLLTARPVMFSLHQWYACRRLQVSPSDGSNLLLWFRKSSLHNNIKCKTL